MLIDTHCHLDFPEFDTDRDAVIKRSQEAGISRIVNIGSSVGGSARSVELSGQYGQIFAAVGVHPHEADKFNKQQEQELKGFLKYPKVVAVGETGLDYFKNYSKPESQRQLFLSLVKLAGESGKPLIIHTREAQVDTLKILKVSRPLRAVVHCFSGDEDFLQECLSLGLFISFTCNITYRKADKLRDLVRLIPLERLFLETDAPFLPPQDMRGKRNEPSFVRQLAEEIAVIKKISFEEVAWATTENARNFFNLP